MRKNVFGRQFKRDANERKALFRGLLTSLVIHERIKTTEEKAKAIRADADKLVTKARKERLHAQMLLQPDLSSVAVKKMINDIAPRFAGRNGGYTRIVRLAPRKTDSARLAMIEWVEKGKALATIQEKPSTGGGSSSGRKKVAMTEAHSEAKAGTKAKSKKAAVKKVTAKKATTKKTVAKKKETK